MGLVICMETDIDMHNMIGTKNLQKNEEGLKQIILVRVHLILLNKSIVEVMRSKSNHKNELRKKPNGIRWAMEVAKDFKEGLHNRAREIQCTFSPHLHHQKLLRLSQEQDFKVKIGNSSNKEKHLEINQDLLRKGVLEIHCPIWLIHLQIFQEINLSISRNLPRVVVLEDLECNSLLNLNPNHLALVVNSNKILEVMVNLESLHHLMLKNFNKACMGNRQLVKQNKLLLLLLLYLISPNEKGEDQVNGIHLPRKTHKRTLV
jgi:hypothetical protein